MLTKYDCMTDETFVGINLSLKIKIDSFLKIDIYPKLDVNVLIAPVLLTPVSA